MKRNSIVAILIGVAGVGILYRYAFAPMRCNILRPHLERATIHAFGLSSSHERVAAGRDTLEKATTLLRQCPDDVAMAMIAGANLRLLGRTEAAAVVYARALRYGPRPELLLQLGAVEAALGRRNDAIEHFAAAVEFNPALIADVPPAFVLEVENVTSATGAHRANELHNADFRSISEEDASSELTSFTPTSATSPSPAAGWTLSNNRATTTRAQLAPSVRDPARSMMRISTGAPYCGLVQTWKPVGSGPARVRTSAWVFVRRGVVMLGSGDGPASQNPNAVSTKTGAWELISGENSSCPANQTVIYAISEGGADFDVEWPTVESIPGHPCFR